MKCLDCDAEIIKDGPGHCDWKHDKGNCIYYLRWKVDQLENPIHIHEWYSYNFSSTVDQCDCGMIRTRS